MGCPEFVVGEVVQKRKVHPCGAVTRVCGDVGLLCVRCGRRISLPLSQLARSVRPISREIVQAAGNNNEQPGFGSVQAPDTIS